jgi:hypothetical protein
VERQTVHRLAGPRDPALPRRTEALEQAQRGGEPVLGRRLEPLERARVAAPGEHVERGRGEVDALDVWLAPRAQAVARVPEAHDAPGPRAAGAPAALLRRVERDALEDEPVEASRGVEAQHLLLARVDHVGDSLDRERGLRDVRGQYHLARGRGGKRLVLLLRAEPPVQRQHARVARTAGELGLRTADLRRAGEEAQHVPGRPREGATDRIDERQPGRVRDVDGVRSAGGLDHRAVVEEARDRPGVEGRRHDDKAQVLARTPRLPAEREGQVRVQAALVELVEHDRAEARQERVRLQATGQDAFRRDEETRTGREAALEAHLPADVLSEGEPLLGGDAARDRARGEATGLEQEHPAVVEERRGDAGRLARAGRGNEHGGPRGRERRAHGADVGVDGKGDHQEMLAASAAALASGARGGRRTG